MRDVLRGLRQALVVLVASAAASLAVAALWSAVRGGGFASTAGLTFMVVAALIGLAGGTTFARAGSVGERAFLGLGPDRDEAGTGSALTGLGVFLLVSLPLFLAGAVLHGSG